MTQTAGLAVTYFDRFLSKTGGALAKQRVQLLALTCTLIAAKFSEIKMPSLDDLCEVAHGLFTKAQLKETELETLHVLQWELHAVTPHAALEQLAIAIEHTDERSKSVLEHADFFIDMSYYMVRPVPITPSYVPPVTSLDTPAPSPTSTPSHPHNPTLTTLPSSTSLADRTPSGAAQYAILKFPPLVVASSALLVAWSHLGHTKAIEAHMHKLCALCGVDEHELLTCQTILLEYFNTTFPKAAEAAERFRERCRAAEATRQLCGGDLDLRPSTTDLDPSTPRLSPSPPPLSRPPSTTTTTTTDTISPACWDEVMIRESL